MKVYTKFICLLLAFAFCIPFVGCTETKEEAPQKTEAKQPQKRKYSSIEEAIGSIECVVDIHQTERENPDYCPELNSYSLVYDTENGTVEVFLLAPADALSKECGAVIWCPDAKITDYRFADVAALDYIVFAMYFRGYTGSQSVGVRDFGGDWDLYDLEVLLDIILECDFIDKYNIVTVSGVMNSIKALRLMCTEKGKEYISGAAFAQPNADYRDYFNNYNEEYKEAYIDHITNGDPSRLEEELSKRNMLEIAENIDPDTELLVASFGEGDESITPTEYTEKFKDKLDELGITYDEYHFDFAGTDFYVPQSIGLLTDWLYARMK